MGKITPLIVRKFNYHINFKQPHVSGVIPAFYDPDYHYHYRSLYNFSLNNPCWGLVPVSLSEINFNKFVIRKNINDLNIISLRNYTENQLQHASLLD